VSILLAGGKQTCSTLQYMLAAERSQLDRACCIQGGNMGMGGMGAMGMGGMGTHSMGMANMGNMSPQMAEMGGMVRAVTTVLLCTLPWYNQHVCST
jgi:hypothetical protein